MRNAAWVWTLPSWTAPSSSLRFSPPCSWARSFSSRSPSPPTSPAPPSSAPSPSTWPVGSSLSRRTSKTETQTETRDAKTIWRATVSQEGRNGSVGLHEAETQRCTTMPRLLKHSVSALVSALCWGSACRVMMERGFRDVVSGIDPNIQNIFVLISVLICIHTHLFPQVQQIGLLSNSSSSYMRLLSVHWVF